MLWPLGPYCPPNPLNHAAHRIPDYGGDGAMTAFDRAWQIVKGQQGCDNCAELFEESQMKRISLGGEAGQGWAFLCPSCAKAEEEYQNTPDGPNLAPSGGADFDSELNDDEFVNQESFNDPAIDIIEQILGIFGDEHGIDQCYGCGLEGDLRTFGVGRDRRKCPSCGSREIHGKDAYEGGD